MSNERKFEIAKEYVDKQLNAMKQFDSAPKNLSASDYRSLVEKVAQTIKIEAKAKGHARPIKEKGRYSVSILGRTQSKRPRKQDTL